MGEITVRVSDRTIKLSLALVSVAVLLLSVSQFGSWDFFHPKYRIQMFVPDASGLKVGTPVTLDSIPVGTVSRVELAKSSTGPNRSVQVTLRIESRFENMIRDDSTASLATEGLLGQPHVKVQRGFSGSFIKPGAEIRFTPVKEISLTDFVEAIKKKTDSQNQGKVAPDLKK